MYQQPKRSLAELSQRKRDITQKIISGHNLDYLAMEKLQRKLAFVNKEIHQLEEEMKDNELNDLHRKEGSNG